MLARPPHPEQQLKIFLDEYSSDDAVRRYTKQTAGYGIDHLLRNEYGRLYLHALREYLSAPISSGARLLEFGCGGGMNLIHLVSLLERHEIPVDTAYGADMSGRLIEAARTEAAKYLPPHQRRRVQFHTARNESLTRDLASALGVSEEGLRASFHLILGINTFRYCHRLGTALDCAKGLLDLLAEGGVCVMIDMNSKFPFFRSRIGDRLTKPKEAHYLPSLEEYARPFVDAGFELLDKRSFCWVPHSARRTTVTLLRAVTPVLNTLAPTYAMRSLVVAKKPGGANPSLRHQ
jgi:SAM-dependent methyltransferase